MPHVNMIINPRIVLPRERNLTAIGWARKHDYSDVRLPFEQVLELPSEIAVWPEFRESLEPRENLLDLEFELKTGRYYKTEHAALYHALLIFGLLKRGVAWKLPQKWGLWFHCKGEFNDPWLDPYNFEEKHKKFMQDA